MFNAVAKQLKLQNIYFLTSVWLFKCDSRRFFKLQNYRESKCENKNKNAKFRKKQRTIASE